jgi:hypothetical protein
MHMANGKAKNVECGVPARERKGPQRSMQRT